MLLPIPAPIRTNRSSPQPLPKSVLTSSQLFSQISSHAAWTRADFNFSPFKTLTTVIGLIARTDQDFLEYQRSGKSPDRDQERSQSGLVLSAIRIGFEYDQDQF
jgi:hypothetical protein